MIQVSTTHLRSFRTLRFTDLAAVTTVSGNVRIEHTTRNALHVLELAGADAVPVHRGAAVPLRVTPRFADGVHGVAGLGAAETPDPQAEVSAVDAIEAILEFCSDGHATIVATGPLTNIAHAIQRDPSLCERIGHLHWMGGSLTKGNVTPFAEFNAWADPDAVDVTLRSGVPLTMYGLNLTHQVRMSSEHIDRLRSGGTETSLRAADFLSFYEQHGVRDGRGQPMHDPCALLGLTHPELFERDPSPIVAHAGDDEWRGMTRETGSPDDQTAHNIVRQRRPSGDRSHPRGGNPSCSNDMSEAFDSFGPVEWFRDQFVDASAASMFRLVLISWFVAALVLIALDRAGSVLLGRSRPLAQHPPERARAWRWGRKTPPPDYSLLPPGVSAPPRVQATIDVHRPLALPAGQEGQAFIADPTFDIDDSAFWRLFAEDDAPMFGFENGTLLGKGEPPERYNPITGRIEALVRSVDDATVAWPDAAESSLIIGGEVE